jgi:hypothetical protein
VILDRGGSGADLVDQLVHPVDDMERDLNLAYLHPVTAVCTCPLTA